MSSGLKEHWGLSEANLSTANSSGQAQEFRTHFTESLARINNSLRFIAAYAAPKKYESLTSQRDKVYTAYQAVAQRIDSAHTTNAQPSIDRVMSAVGVFETQISEVYQTTSKLSKQWLSREASYESACDQVLALEEQEHERAPILRQIIDGIATKVNDRDWGGSAKVFDQLLPKLNQITALATAAMHTPGASDSSSELPPSDEPSSVSSTEASATGPPSRGIERSSAQEGSVEGQRQPPEDRLVTRRETINHIEQELRRINTQYGLTLDI